MQLVLSNNRIIAHGENFLAMGGVVINTETGAKYENATIAECNGCPSDIDKVGYEYHAGVFVPCAPYGVGNNNGFFMEVCESCATPRSSGIPIKKGLNLDNLNETFAKQLPKLTVLWENATTSAVFEAQTITLASNDYDLLLIETISSASSASNAEKYAATSIIHKNAGFAYMTAVNNNSFGFRSINVKNSPRLYIDTGREMEFRYSTNDSQYVSTSNYTCTPLKIYGVKL